MAPNAAKESNAGEGEGRRMPAAVVAATTRAKASILSGLTSLPATCCLDRFADDSFYSAGAGDDLRALAPEKAVVTRGPTRG